MKKLIAFTILGLIAFVCALVGATVIGYSDWSLISTPANPASGFLRLYSDSGTSTVKCKTSAGAACFFATSLTAVTIETNGVNNSSQTTLNIKSGGSVLVTNPSAGDVNITGPAFQTDGTPNATQTTLNLKAGANITLTNSGADVTIAASGGGAALTLQVNGTPNGSQTLLNLVAGSNITLTDNGTGSITVAASGGGGGTVTSVTASAPLTSSGGATPNISASWQGNGSLIQRSTGSTTTGNCAKFDANGNVVDAGAACGTSGDFPDFKTIPAANCNNATGGNGWSIGSGGTVTCRAGTNNLGGYINITDTSSTFAQFAIAIPQDWDSGQRPYIRFQIASADTNSGHTIIPAIQVSCAKGDGSTTDDVSFNASHSLSTVTLNSTANQFWSTSNVQMNSTDTTGCSAGSLMLVQVGRATDTATSAHFYSATMTFPRALVQQAN